MNHLAHFHLSSDKRAWLLGGLLGDFVKGPLRGDYPGDWEQGIVLHRRIDSYTDSHPLWAELRGQFAPSYRRYSGIMLDIAADHFLIQHWQQFSDQPLEQFCQHIYQLLAEPHTLPEQAALLAQRLVEHQSLQSYQDWQGVEKALWHVSQRLRRSNPLADAGPELQRHYPQIEAIFLRFYPQLIAYAKQQKLTLHNKGLE
jgi:acyl carrier protein phosphodiesterase